MSATNCPETPRQKMISMMYLVYTALLALNVSVEILHGYTLVDGSLRKSIKIADARNTSLNTQFENLSAQNKAKTAAWKAKADNVVAKSDALYNYIDSVKLAIVTLVDGEEADTKNLMVSEEKAGNLDIAGQVGQFGYPAQNLQPAGKGLRQRIENYTKEMVGLVDSSMKSNIESTFKIEDKKKEGEIIKWETTVFDGMPAVATMTVLSKLQNDIRNTESEIVQHLIGQIDAGDFRVNKIEALVIPDSKYLIKGAKYHAQIVLAATDSTRPLEIEIGGKPIENGVYEFGCGSTGKFEYKGNIKMKKPNGEEVTYPFNSDYVVGEPSATISADMMNVFYCGIANPLSVSVPGVPARDVSISITNARQVQTAKGWNITPIKVGVEAVVTVTANINGRPNAVAKKAFRVKALPPPLAKLEVSNKGTKEHFKGGGIGKDVLLTADKVIAELDDADLDVRYSVLSFQLNYFDSMGNTIVEMSSGPNLTSRQKDVFKKLVKGKTVFITQTKAKGPDGITRSLPPIEIKLK